MTFDPATVTLAKPGETPPLTEAQKRLYSIFGVAFFYKKVIGDVIIYEPLEKVAELIKLEPDL